MSLLSESKQTRTRAIHKDRRTRNFSLSNCITLSIVQTLSARSSSISRGRKRAEAGSCEGLLKAPCTGELHTTTWVLKLLPLEISHTPTKTCPVCVHEGPKCFMIQDAKEHTPNMLLCSPCVDRWSLQLLSFSTLSTCYASLPLPPTLLANFSPLTHFFHVLHFSVYVQNWARLTVVG